MYSSMFSYNVTRPYPYRWFTWVAVLGGLVATVLVSTINLAANGYTLTVLSSSDPHETIVNSTTGVLRHKPWALLSKVKAKCDNQSLSLGSVVYTTTGLFEYTIKTIRMADQHGQFHQSLSMAYQKKPLHCVITSARISNTPAAFDDTFQDESSSIIVAVSALVNCSIMDKDSQTSNYLTLKLDRTYDHNNILGWDSQKFNDQQRPFALWASNLLAIYLEFIIYPSKSYYSLLPQGFKSDVGVAAWSMYLNNLDPFANPRIPSLWIKTHNLSAWSNQDLTYDLWNGAFGSDLLSLYNFTFNDNTSTLPDSVQFSTLVMDGLGRILYSLVNADFGQVGDQQIFNGADQIWKLLNSTLNFSPNASIPLPLDEVADTEISFDNTSNDYYLFNDTSNERPETLFNWTKIGIPAVRNSDSFFDALYLCQVPQLKPSGSLIISILIADLVLLKSLWSVFTWCTRSMAQRRDQTADHCPCCVHATEKDKADADTVTQVTPLLKSPDSNVVLCDPEPGSSISPTTPMIKRRPVPAPRTPSSHGQSTSTMRPY